MDYELKFGLIGLLLDLVVVRGKWQQGIREFFAGLKKYAESSKFS
jgi:hypothetical protein